jgi:hypothetical protein
MLKGDALDRIGSSWVGRAERRHLGTSVFVFATLEGRSEKSKKITTLYIYINHTTNKNIHLTKCVYLTQWNRFVGVP